MTATKTKTDRTLRVNWTATPLDTTVLSVTVTEGKRVDGYHAFHAADSCEVSWTHDDEPERSYTVVCSASTGQPVRCSCPGFGYGRGKACRHMSATAVLIRRGDVVIPRLVDAGHDRAGDIREQSTHNEGKTMSDIKSAAYRAMSDEGRNDLGQAVRHRMCELLDIAPWQLDELLTDEVIEEILCG